MSSTQTASRTALAPRVAAEVSVPSFTFEQMERMAQSMAKSGLFGVRTPDQALALMLISQAEGRHPALAAQDYHIIQGKPSLKADTILSRFQQSGGVVKWHEFTDKRVHATFSHPKGATVTIDWTIERAQSVKTYNEKKNQMEALTDKLNWQNYPRAMLRARTISEGVRSCYPRASGGMYTPEELTDGAVEIVDVTPVSQDAAVKQTVESRTPLTAEEREEHLKTIKDSPDQEKLAHAFAAAWKHANEAKDTASRDAFKAAYDARKAQLAEPLQSAEQ